MTDQVGVVGAGAWGTTLAIKLAAAERPVTLWAHTAEAAEELATLRENRRYLPGIVFPPNLRVATEDDYLAEPHRAFLLAVPSAYLRETLRRLGTTLYPDASLLSVVKGIEQGTHLRMSEVIEQELPGRRVAALSGPNLAREIAQDGEDELLASRRVAASPHLDQARGQLPAALREQARRHRAPERQPVRVDEGHAASAGLHGRLPQALVVLGLELSQRAEEPVLFGQHLAPHLGRVRVAADDRPADRGVELLVFLDHVVVEGGGIRVDL